MIEIQQAYEALAEAVGAFPPLEAGEPALTDASLGRYLAEDLPCLLDNPPFSQSAMDGIAFRFSKERQTYHCLGTVAAGDAPEGYQLDEGTCVRIMTGAPVPQTADTVEMVEKISFDGEMVRLLEPVNPGQHIRVRGENTKVDDRLYAKGTKITPGVMAGLLSQGHRYLPLKRKLRIGIAATGNEVIDYRQPLGPGQIYNSNAPSMAALLNSSAIDVCMLGTLPDDQERTRAMLSQMAELDIILLSGGVSMGNFDMVPDAAQSAGFQKIFHKIRMKPGKPVWFGRHERGTLLFGMPGNPVSVLVGTILYVLPSIAGILSGNFQQPCWGAARAASEFRNRGGLTLFQGVHLTQSSEGLYATPLKTSGSGDIIRFSTFQSLCRLAPGEALKRDDRVEVLLPFPMGIS